MHNGCILCGGVGVGKTHTAIQYYLNNEAPKPVFVMTTAKKRDKGDWQDIFAEVGMHKDPELTMGAVVTVDSWENIKKYEEVEGAFFIFDEQRLVGTGAWVKAFYKIAKANRWIMLSATPGDNWLDYVPVFRANGLIKNITAFKEDHVVQRWTGRYYQVVGYRQVPKLVRWRNQLLVDMPYEKHTTRHTHEVEVEYDRELVRRLVDKRWHVYEDRPLTDASELFRVMRKVVYSDASRLAAIRRLTQTHPKLIVFYNFDYELEILRTLAFPGLPEPSTRSRSSSEASSTQSTRPASGPSTLETKSTSSRGRISSTDSCSEQESRTTRKVSGSKNASIDTSGLSVDPRLSPSLQTSSTNTSPARKESDSSWDYLLSPQGMAENQFLIQSSQPKRHSSTSDQTISGFSTPTRAQSHSRRHPKASSEQDGHWTEDTGLGEVWIPETCPTKEALRTETITGNVLSADISTPQEFTPVETVGTNEMETSRSPSSGTLTPTSLSTPETTSESSEDDEAILFEQTLRTHPLSDPLLEDTTRHDTAKSSRNNSGSSSRTFSSKKASLPIRTGSSTRPPINQRPSEKQSKMDLSQEKTSPTSPECSQQKTNGQQSNDDAERTEECQKQKKTLGQSQRMPTRTSTRSGSPDAISKINDDAEKLLDLRRKHFTQKSSQESKKQSARSSTGRSSTSSQQFQVAEWNGHKHDSVPTTTSWVYLVQYVAGAEAWECTETDAMVFWSMPYSYKLWWQSHGRIDRLNTPFKDLHYYILMSKATIDKGVKKSLAAKKSFNESAFLTKMGW